MGRRAAIDLELGRLAEAVALQGVTSALMKAITERESERRAIEQILWGSSSRSGRRRFPMCESSRSSSSSKFAELFRPTTKRHGMNFRNTLIAGSLCDQRRTEIRDSISPRVNGIWSEIGIGGTVARPPLPHHRTCGSAYGGSVS